MKRENLIALIIGASVLILVNLPIFYFYLFPKDNLVFLGRRVINSQDTYTYVSFIEESKQGKWIFNNLYTTEKQTPSLIRPSYLVLGKLAAILDISSVSAFHLGRLLLSIAFLIVLYKFISKFFDTSEKRIIAFVILLTSSGLGFILHLIIPNTTDLWIPEANTFMSLAEAPHFILSQMLMVGGFMSFLTFLEKKKIRYLLSSALCFLLLAFEHPYDLFVVGAVIFLTTLFAFGLTPGNIARAGMYGFMLSFGILYQIWQAISNPILKNFQVDNLSPSPTNYLAGFGLLIPLAIIGAEDFIKQTAIKYKLILIWIFVIAAVIYSPFNFQRRMIEGIHIPLSILAATGLFIASDYVSKMFGKNFRTYFIYGAVFLLSFSSIYTIYNDFTTLGKDSIQSYYYYISKSEYEGIQWLKANTKNGNSILSNWFYGNIIPGLTGNKVYLGHKAQSGDFDRKIDSINQFLLSNNNSDSIRFLKASRIKYIFLGNNDSMLQYGFKPDQKPFLKKAYAKNGVSIYQVR